MSLLMTGVRHHKIVMPGAIELQALQTCEIGNQPGPKGTPFAS